MSPPARDEMHVQQEIARTRQFFNKSRPARTTKASPTQEYIFSVTSSLIPPGRVGVRAVDLGCQWGRYTKFIAETYGEVIGVDFSEKALATAEKGPNISYTSMDLNARESGLLTLAPVDFFFANAVFEMLENPARICEQLAACGSRGAVVLALIPNRRSINFVTFRAALWIATRLLGKRGRIYNNDITLASLIGWLQAAGFTIENRGAIIGVPVYLISVLPARLQQKLLKLDKALLRFIGGSYHWVIATKALRGDGAK